MTPRSRQIPSIVELDTFKQQSTYFLPSFILWKNDSPLTLKLISTSIHTLTTSAIFFSCISSCSSLVSTVMWIPGEFLPPACDFPYQRSILGNTLWVSKKSREKVKEKYPFWWQKTYLNPNSESREVTLWLNSFRTPT